MDWLTMERYGPPPRRMARREQDTDAAVIAERRRILCGTDDLSVTVEQHRGIRLRAARRAKDAKLTKAIRTWTP